MTVGLVIRAAGLVTNSGSQKGNCTKGIQKVNNTNQKATPLVALLPYQKAAVESNARFRWSNWARQTGKSFTLSLRRIIRGLQRRRNQIFLSASERQSRELMQKARQHCQALHITARHYNERFLDGVRYKQLEIELPGGVRIIGLPAKPETIRGFTGDVFLDEFAMHADDRAIWAATFPTLLRGDGELDIASTPKGKGNIFYELSKNEKFERSTITLQNAVDQGLDVSCDEIRTSMADEELYRQEFQCEFVDEATALLTYEQIARCEDATIDKDISIKQIADECKTMHKKTKKSPDLSVGLDIGRKRDLTVFWIIQRIAGIAQVARALPDASNSTHAARALPNVGSFRTVAVYELSNTPFREQFDILRQIMSLKYVRRCCIDAGGIGMHLAESAVEKFGPHRIEPVTFTAATKSHMAGTLRIAIESATLKIPTCETIRNDFHSLQRSITSAGHFRLDAAHSKTGHADRFWAAALALQAAETASTQHSAISVKPLAFAQTGTW